MDRYGYALLETASLPLEQVEKQSNKDPFWLPSSAATRLLAVLALFVTATINMELKIRKKKKSTWLRDYFLAINTF